jgi:hypothetical protein
MRDQTKLNKVIESLLYLKQLKTLYYYNDRYRIDGISNQIINYLRGVNELNFNHREMRQTAK